MKTAAIRRSNQLLGISISWKVGKNLTSWIRSHEKINFDLMKFDLMIISLPLQSKSYWNWFNNFETIFNSIRRKLIADFSFKLVNLKYCLILPDLC
jgi:predicted YcjX-like family ATPase